MEFQVTFKNNQFIRNYSWRRVMTDSSISLYPTTLTLNIIIMRCLIIICFVFFNSILEAQQTFSYTYSSSNDEYILDANEDEYGNFYLSGFTRIPNHNYFKGLIIIINPYGSYITEKVYSLPDKSYLISNISQDSAGSFIILGSYVDTTIQFTKGELHLKRINYNLETIDSASYYISDDRSLNIIYSDIGFNNEILINSTSLSTINNPPALLFAMRLNSDFDSIYATTYPFPSVGTGIKQLSDTTYWMYTGIFHEIVITDTMFNQIEQSSLPETIADPLGIKWDSDSSFYLCGQWNNQNGDKDISIIKLFNPIDTTDYVFKPWGTKDTTDYPAGRGGALDFNNKDSIFIGGTTGFTGTWGYRSYYSLIQTDSLLNVRWEKFYGGDAYYEMNDVLATNDGGCLLSGMRYDSDIGIQEHDIYVIKVDGNGLLVGLEPEQSIKSFDAVVFPNPGTNEVNVRVAAQYHKAEINMYEINGTKVLTKELVGRHNLLNTESLKSGTYIYSINNKNGLNESGIWIKK